MTDEEEIEKEIADLLGIASDTSDTLNPTTLYVPYLHDYPPFLWISGGVA